MKMIGQMRTRLIAIVLAGMLIGGMVAPAVSVSPATAQGEEDETLTVLLMGLDRREGEPLETGVRPDALGVLHLDFGNGTCRLLSVPRDTRTAVPGYGMTKVNHAYSFEGAELEVETVEGLLGVEIDRYGAIDMQGFALLVDAAGGVVIQNPEQFSLGAYAYASSPQTLTGQEALAYSRYRGGPDGDFGRIRRQQQLVQAFLESTAELDVATFVPEAMTVLSGHMNTDMALDELVSIGTMVRESCTAETIGLDVVNGTAALAWDDVYQQELWMVLTEPAEIEQKVAWLLGGS